jgi:hypothetical protein
VKISEQAPFYELRSGLALKDTFSEVQIVHHRENLEKERKQKSNKEIRFVI